MAKAMHYFYLYSVRETPPNVYFASVDASLKTPRVSSANSISTPPTTTKPPETDSLLPFPRSCYSSHATPNPISPLPPRINLSLHPLQTSSNPPTTSPQTLAHSLVLNLSSHPPLSTHLIPSSLSSHSLFSSATASRLERSRLAASVVVCRVICRVSER